MDFFQSRDGKYQCYRFGYRSGYWFQQHHRIPEWNYFQYCPAWRYGLDAAIDYDQRQQFLDREGHKRSVHGYRNLQRWQHPESDKHSNVGIFEYGDSEH